MKRKLAVFFLVVFFSFVAVASVDNHPANFGDPLPGLTAAQVAQFVDGKAEFTHVETEAEGLGPIFNGKSCAECHSTPAVGGGSERTVTRFGRTTNGVFDPLAGEGGSLLQQFALDGHTVEQVPHDANTVAHRRTGPLFGFGLIDNIPDGELQVIAALEQARHNGTAGRVHMVSNMATGTMTAGKFGWKAQVPTLFQFAGDAYRNEMGITNPLFQTENCANCADYMEVINDGIDGVEALANFMTLLAPPPRDHVGGNETAGENIAARIGCLDCHVATLYTGLSEVAALRLKTFHPYSDFLLHDMGSLGDGIVQGQATGSEFRTAPLWGLRTVTHLLHDGRATNINDAILAHDGQGRGARDRYVALSAQEKAKLLAFLNSL